MKNELLKKAKLIKQRLVTRYDKTDYKWIENSLYIKIEEPIK